MQLLPEKSKQIQGHLGCSIHKTYLVTSYLPDTVHLNFFSVKVDANIVSNDASPMKIAESQQKHLFMKHLIKQRTYTLRLKHFLNYLTLSFLYYVLFLKNYKK